MSGLYSLQFLVSHESSKCKTWAHSPYNGLSLNQKFVKHSYKYCASIAPNILQAPQTVGPQSCGWLGIQVTLSVTYRVPSHDKSRP